MANYANIKDTINQNIKTNGNQQITGQVLQNVLNAIVDNLTAGYLLVGIATEDGNPGTPDQNVCWLATKGTYANYGNITVESGKLAVIKYNGTWTSDTVDVQGAVSAGDGINISETGAVSVKTGTGIKIDEEGNVAADLVAGDNISIEGNKINCTLDANPFYFVDALPDSPVPGTENKVYVVSDTASTALNLYQWNAETSQFDLVGTIDLGIDTSNFVKKGTNDITEPLELVTEEGIGSTGEMLYLRNKNGVRIGIILKFGDDTNIMRSSGLQAVKDRDGNPSIALKCVLSSLKLSQDGTLQLSANNFMEGIPIRPTFYIEAPDGNYWSDIGATFTISGLFNLIKSRGNAIAYGLKNPNNKTIYSVVAVYIPGADDDNQQINLSYVARGNTLQALINSDDSVVIASMSKLVVLWADNYNLIASGMPRPDAWLVADGTDTTLYKAINDAYKNGDNLILKEYSYGSSSCNQYTVKNILDLGTGYQLFYESNGLQYILTINSDGSIITDCNVINGSDFGANFAVTTVGKTSIDLANRLKRLYNARMRIVLEQKAYQFCVDVINQDTASGTLNLVYSVFLVIDAKFMVSKLGMIINYNNGNYSISYITNA